MFGISFSRFRSSFARRKTEIMRGEREYYYCTSRARFLRKALSDTGFEGFLRGEVGYRYMLGGEVFHARECDLYKGCVRLREVLCLL